MDKRAAAAWNQPDPTNLAGIRLPSSRSAGLRHPPPRQLPGAPPPIFVATNRGSSAMAAPSSNHGQPSPELVFPAVMRACRQLEPQEHSAVVQPTPLRPATSAPRRQSDPCLLRLPRAGPRCFPYDPSASPPLLRCRRTTASLVRTSSASRAHHDRVNLPVCLDRARSITAAQAQLPSPARPSSTRPCRPNVSSPAPRASVLARLWFF